MKAVRLRFAIVALLMSFSLACVFSGLGSAGGPGNFAAKATSPSSVMLTWSAVQGATGYQLEVKMPGRDQIKIADLAASQLSYEDFLAPAGTQLTYRVSAVTASGTGGGSEVGVTTSARVPNPLAVQVEFDQKKVVTQNIGPEGGSISLKDAKGVEYKLTIPAGALDQVTEIKLTAVTNIGGWPLDGKLLGAVRVEPEGLALNDVATLAFSLPANVPSDTLSTLGFGFQGTGQEFHLQPALQQKSTTGLVPRNSNALYLASLADIQPAVIVKQTALASGGLGTGSARSAGEVAKGNSPTDAGAALDQQLAAQLAENDDLASLPDIVNPYESALVEAAGNLFVSISQTQDCGEVRSAVGSVTGWLWEANSRNLDPSLTKAGHDLMVGDLAQKIKQVIDDAASKCKKQDPKQSAPPGTGCAQGLIRSVSAGSTQLFKDIQQKMIQDYGTGALSNPDADLKKCSKRFSVAAPAGDIKFSGTICSLEVPFSLDISGAASGKANFTPSTKTNGTVSYYAEGGGVSFDAIGTYSVEGVDSEAPVLKIDVNEVSHTPLGDFPHSQSAGLPLGQVGSGSCK